VDRNKSTSLPDRKTMAKNLLQAAGQAVKKGFKPRSKGDQEKCLEICHKCEFYIKDRCGKCGCYLSWKTKLRAWNCPEGKW
jgi:hypothetical protein